MKYSLGSSNFLEEISRVSIVFFSSISLHCSLKKTFLYLLAVLWTLLSDGYIFLFLLCLSLLFFSQLFGRPPQTTILPFCISFLGGMVLITASCAMALCLSDLIPWIYLSLPLYNCNIWFRSHLNGLLVFPTFLNLSLNFSIRSSWSEP